MANAAAARHTYDAHHYACVMDNAVATQSNTLSVLVNCEVAFILYICDELLCSYFYTDIVSYTERKY